MGRNTKRTLCNIAGVYVTDPVFILIHRLIVQDLKPLDLRWNYISTSQPTQNSDAKKSLVGVFHDGNLGYTLIGLICK